MRIAVCLCGAHLGESDASGSLFYIEINYYSIIKIL